MIKDLNISSRDVCKLLEACSKFNVAEFSIGDFYVSFKVNGAKSRETLKMPTAITVPEEITRAADAIAQKTEESTEIDEAEDEDLRLVVEDPAAWERRSLEMMRERKEEKSL
jgi:hypothetical protein